MSASTSKLRQAALRVKDYVAIGREAAGQNLFHAPGVLTKTVVARLSCDIGPVDFCLNDLARRPRATWKDYLREEPQNYKLVRILHPQDVMGIARDKVVTAERCVENGLPIIPILAVVGRRPEHPCQGRFPMLDTPEAIVERLPEWPDNLFVKPVSGFLGEGVMALARDGDRWHDGNAVLSASEVAARLLGYSDPTGVLVQPRVANHPDVAAASSGPGLCATRIITALTQDGPELVAAIHKILGRDALADNFVGGATGNLLCGVDNETGRLSEGYGRRPGDRLLLHAYSRHPTTGRALKGVQLPYWPEARELALRAATIFPELPLLGHDIAITPDGPLFLETNTYWRINLPQLARGGLRPILRVLIPRLVMPEERKREALRIVG